MATLRLFQGTEINFTISATNSDGTPIIFDDIGGNSPSIIFTAFDNWNARAQMFQKTGSLDAPNADVVLDDTAGQITCFIRAIDTVLVAKYSEWSYYVELDPNDGLTGPFPLDIGQIIIRNRITTPNAVPNNEGFLQGFPWWNNWWMNWSN